MVYSNGVRIFLKTPFHRNVYGRREPSSRLNLIKTRSDTIFLKGYMGHGSDERTSSVASETPSIKSHGDTTLVFFSFKHQQTIIDDKMAFTRRTDAAAAAFIRRNRPVYTVWVHVSAGAVYASQSETVRVGAARGSPISRVRAATYEAARARLSGGGSSSAKFSGRNDNNNSAIIMMTMMIITTTTTITTTELE